jgi:hypothetical protein
MTHDSTFRAVSCVYQLESRAKLACATTALVTPQPTPIEPLGIGPSVPHKRETSPQTSIATDAC